MGVERIFVDWCGPLLPAVADELLRRHGRDDVADLSQAIAVVPGRRAGRRLRELLATMTGGRHVPPRIVTVGELPELLYESQRPFASGFVQRLAWIEAVRKCPAQRIKTLFRELPAADDHAGWLALADFLAARHQELAADGMEFRDVHGHVALAGHSRERSRWRALDDIQQAYWSILDDLKLWDVQKARLVAIENREIATAAHIYLIGAADLTRTQRRMLDQVADRVTAFVHAPRELADRFDDHGCVLPEAWCDAALDLAAGQMTVVEGPAEQVAAVVRAVADFNGRFRADEISIGVASEPLAPHLERMFAECGVPARWGVGASLAQSLPCRLLAAISDYLDDDRTPQFAALARHPDVGDWLTRRNVGSEWLPELDGFVCEHLPHRLGDSLTRRHAGPLVQRAAGLLANLLAPLTGGERPLTEWGPRLLDLVRDIYADSEFDSQRPGDRDGLQAFDGIQETLAEQTALPARLAPRLSATSAIRLLLDELAAETLTPPSDAGAIDLVGWLELPLDDAPAVVLVGFNEGLIPQSVTADAVLPDGLRTALGLTDNSRRYARDAHALAALVHSRQVTRLIAARRDARGDPLAPSRLLLAGEPRAAARRIREFYQPAAGPASPPAGVLQATRIESDFPIPRPRPAEPPTELRVTWFRDYLASPYRFYLKHILKLRDADDAADELSGAAFGNLAHEALKRFGLSATREATSAAEIDAFLQEAVGSIAGDLYGHEPRAVVQVQLQQARLRLRAFADWQAQWRAEGWRIAFAEVEQQVPFEIGEGHSVSLFGRIDRIDHHPDTRRWIVFDYKTGDTSQLPEKTHRAKSEWIDLQLPLYRHLARPLGVMGDVRLGYIRLPRDTNDIREELAAWTDADLRSADDTARIAAQRILAGEFWEEFPDPVTTMQEYSAICQDDVFDSRINV